MGWPKGKPRLSEEQRAERVARSERPMYDMVIPYRHGDGRVYGCGEFITSYRLLDEGGSNRAKEIMTAHKNVCWFKESKPSARKAAE